MSFYKYLDASTGHITKEDNKTLFDHTIDRDLIPGCYVYPYDCGYFISVYEDAPTEEEKKESDLSDNFFKLLDYAREHECYLIRIDESGDILEGLEHFNW